MITNFIHRLLLAALDEIFTLKCLKCGKNKNYLCENCKEKLIESNAPIYSEIKEINPVRNSPLEFINATTNITEQQSIISNGIKVFSALSYKNPLTKKLIWHLKYRNKRKISEMLADIILAKFRFLKNSSDKIIVPVPISKKRLRQRGYNQTALIASELSLKSGIPICQNILTKKFNTLSQVETKTKSERIKNLKGSFEVIADGTPSTVNHSFTVLLLDDVITTGATLNEAAKTLKSDGFKKIMGITVAKG